MPLMKDGLAVAADESYFLGRNLEFAARGHRGLGEKLSQSKISLAESARGDGVLFGDAKNFLANRRRKFDGGMAEQLGIQMRRCARDASEGNVNAIGGCSGHHAENKHGFFAHEICFFSSARRLSASRGFNWSRSAPRSFSRTSRSRAVKSTRWLPFLFTTSEAPGVSVSLSSCSLCSCLFKTSRARSITLRGRPASRATSMP